MTEWKLGIVVGLSAVYVGVWLLLRAPEAPAPNMAVAPEVRSRSVAVAPERPAPRPRVRSRAS